MGFRRRLSEGGNLVWKQTWLLLLALHPVPQIVKSAFVSMQSRKWTVAEVQAVYNHMIGDLKSLGGVEKVAAGESEPADAVALGMDYISRESVMAMLENDFTSLELNEELEEADEKDGVDIDEAKGTRMEAVVLAAGHCCV
jgi:hypothetical protein